MEEAIGERAIGRNAAARRDGRALLLRDGDVAVDLLLRLARYDRPKVGPGIQAVAHLQLLGSRDEPVDEVVRDGTVGDDPGRGGAALPRGAERGPDDPLEREVEVRVVHDDDRVLPAKLRRHALELPARDLADVRADVARSGERHEVDAGVGDECVAESAARAEHEVEHALREPRGLEDLHEPHRQHRRVRRRLEDDAVPEHEGGHDLPRRDRERKVPWCDGRDDAERCPHRHRPLVRELRRHDVAELAASLARGVVGHVDALLDIATGFGEDLAHLARHLSRELLLALEHDLAGLVQDLAALGGRVQAPGVEGPPRRVDGAIHIRLRGSRGGRDDLARRWVEVLERLAARRVGPAPVDVVLQMRRGHSLPLGRDPVPGRPSATRGAQFCQNCAP